MSEWQDIATAPKDGTRVLIYQQEGDGEDPTRTIGIAQWGQFNPRSCAWCMEGGDSWGAPTHWQPLPAPPLYGEGTDELIT